MSNNISGNTQATELKYAVQTIKTAILQSQSKATKIVSGIQLSLYYGVGLYVSAHSRKVLEKQKMKQKVKQKGNYKISLNIS